MSIVCGVTGGQIIGRDQEQQMTRVIYAALSKRINQPHIFGDQPIVNADDEIESMEWRLLSAPCSLTVYEIGNKIHELGGLFIASHIGRPVFSIFSQLGVISGNERFDAVALTCPAAKADWADKIQGLPILLSSDAHHLDAIARIWNKAETEQFTTTHLKIASARTGLRTLSLKLPWLIKK